MRFLIICALAASVSAPALGRAMKVGDLGATATRQACLDQAAAVLQSYIDQYGGQSVTAHSADPDNWAVYGWGLRPGVTDLVISCPVVGPLPNAFFAIHADGPEGVANADLVAARIRELWAARR